MPRETNLIDQLLTEALEERLRNERKYFVKTIKDKVQGMVEAKAEPSFIITELLKFLNETEIHIYSRDPYDRF